MDIKIIQTGPSRTGGDCTTYFKAKFETNPTLQQFIAWILKERPSEWVDVSLSGFGGRLVEYNRGTITYANPVCEESLDKVIELVSYCGGWSRSDYLVKFV